MRNIISLSKPSIYGRLEQKVDVFVWNGIDREGR